MAGGAAPGQLYPGQYTQEPTKPQLRGPLFTPQRQSRPSQQEAWPNLLATTLGSPAGVPFRSSEAERVVRRTLNRSDLEPRNLAIAAVGAPFASRDLEGRRASASTRDGALASLALTLATPAAAPFVSNDLEGRRLTFLARDSLVALDLELTTLATPVVAPVGQQDVTAARRVARRAEELQPNPLSSALYTSTQTVLRATLHSPARPVRTVAVTFDAPNLLATTLATPSTAAPFTAADVDVMRRYRARELGLMPNLPLTTLAPAVGAVPFQVADMDVVRRSRASEAWLAPNLAATTLSLPVVVPVGQQDTTVSVRRTRRVEELQPNLLGTTFYASTQTVLRAALYSPARPVRAPAPLDVPNLIVTTLTPAVGGVPFKIAADEAARRYRAREAWPTPNLALTTLGVVQLAPFITEDLSQRLARFTSRTIDPTGLPLVMFSVGAPFYNPDFVMRQPYTVSRAVEPLGAPLTLRGVGSPFYNPDFSVRQPYAVSKAVEPIWMPLALRTVGVPFKPSDQEGARRVARRVVEDFSNLLARVPVAVGAPFKPGVESERRAARRLRPEEFGTPQPILAAQLVASAYRIYHVPPQDRVRIVALQDRIRVIEAQSRLRLLTAEERTRLVELQDRLRIIEAQVRRRIIQ